MLCCGDGLNKLWNFLYIHHAVLYFFEKKLFNLYNYWSSHVGWTFILETPYIWEEFLRLLLIFEVPRNCRVGCKLWTTFQLQKIPLHCKSKLRLCKFFSLFMKKDWSYFNLIKRWKLIILICFVLFKNPQKKYQRWKEDCGLSYTLPQSRLSHEKLRGHMPQKRRDRNEPLYDAEFKMFKCSFPNCSVLSKRKSNLKKHTTTCQAIKKRKHSKLACPFCKVTFSHKFSRDRHVKNIHQEDTLVFVHDVT